MGGNSGGYFSPPRTRASLDQTPPSDAAGKSKLPAKGAVGDGRSGVGGGSGGVAGGDPCDIRTHGTLRSPLPAAVSALSIGEVLTVRVHHRDGIEVLVAAHGAYGDVGVIDCPDEQAIIDCIAAGNRYTATVRRRQGGAVTLDISRAKS